MSKGLLYITGDDEHYREAVRSAESARRAMPDMDIAIVTDKSEPHDVFDDVIIRELEYSFVDKVDHIGESPFERTVFVDTDTFFHRRCTELFSILEAFDLAVAHSPARETRAVDVPAPFTEYNTGVIAFQQSAAVLDLFADWQDRYYQLQNERDISGDQASFRKAVYESDVRVCTLPPEYNCRSIFPGYLYDEATIIHGRNQDLPRVASTLNAVEGMRIHYARDDTVSVMTNGPNIPFEYLQRVYDWDVDQ